MNKISKKIGFVVTTFLLSNLLNLALASPQALINKLHQQAPALSVSTLTAAVDAYQFGLAHHQIKNKHLAVVDMTLASANKRLWVFDMRSDSLLYHSYVAQGKASGLFKATHFSNQFNSDATSIGVYLTSNEYHGEHGASLRLRGMDKGFNDNAFKRDIVLHSANYVSQRFVNTYHRLGRSWGCPAVSQKLIKPLVNTLKNGAMLMIYYPQKQWLQHSRYLQQAHLVSA